MSYRIEMATSREGLQPTVMHFLILIIELFIYLMHAAYDVCRMDDGIDFSATSFSFVAF
jgi:hypothetical protein